MRRWTTELSLICKLGLALLLSIGAFACAPAIGDECQSSADCSVNGERICDVAYPDGYCTVGGCSADTCPDESVCVEWRFTPDRTAVSFCMADCVDDSECRPGYACMADSDGRLIEEETGEPIARVLDRESGQPLFCVAVMSIAL